MLAPTMPEYPWEETWFQYFRELIGQSPVLGKYWKEHSNWYAAGIKKFYPSSVWELLLDKK